MKTLICLLALGMLLTGFSYAIVEEDIVAGLVGYWPLDGDGIDKSGMGNDGIVKGNPQMVTGQVGAALDFDGDGDGIEIPSNPTLELPDALTVAAWIFPRATKDAAGNDHAGVVWKGNKIGWGTDVYNFRIATAGDAGLTWGATGGGTEGYFATSNCFVNGLNQWYHVALVEDGSEGLAYVNGVEQTDADVTGGNMHRPSAPYDTWPDEPVRIGWSQGRGGDVNTLVYFDGIIDEVVIYNRALSGAQIRQLMEQGLPATAVEPGGKLTTTWSGIKAQ